MSIHRLTMKHTTTFLAVLFILTACGTSHRPVGESSGTTSEAESGAGGGPGGGTSPPMSGTDTGDGGEQCDDETLALMNGCIQTESDELEIPENTCAEEATRCGYEQCTGSYYQSYYGAYADVRQYCAETYPACAEFAQVSYYECLAGCFEDLATCDDGDECLSCGEAMGICTAACEP